MQNIYGAPPPSTEYHNEVIEDIQTIVQVMWTQGCKLKVLAQVNVFLTISNSAVMSQLEHMNLTINVMQEQLKKLASAQNNQAMPKRKF